MNFDKISGNRILKNSLNAMESQNRMPHAVIINGGNQESRHLLAVHLSAWAVCSGNDKPCHTCKNCVNAENQAHSDIYFAKGEGKTGIYNVDSLRGIIADSYIKPNQADRKVYVFEECDKRFRPDAQNTFLKTLEEPPQDVLFIMTCENSRAFLETIRSRATMLTLEKETILSPDALELAKEIAININSSQEYDLLKSLNKLSKREQYIEVMETLLLLLRDGLAVSVNGEAVTDSDTAYKLCKRLTKSQYIKLIEISQDAIIKVSQNISLKLISTWLCGEYRRISWQR